MGKLMSEISKIDKKFFKGNLNAFYSRHPVVVKIVGSFS